MLNFSCLPAGLSTTILIMSLWLSWSVVFWALGAVLARRVIIFNTFLFIYGLLRYSLMFYGVKLLFEMAPHVFITYCIQLDLMAHGP